MRLRLALTGRGAAVIIIGGLCLLTGSALRMPLLNLSGDALVVLLLLAFILGVLELRGVTVKARLSSAPDLDGRWEAGVSIHAARAAGPFGLSHKQDKHWCQDVPLHLPDAAFQRMRLQPPSESKALVIRLRTVPLGLVAVSSLTRVPWPVEADPTSAAEQRSILHASPAASDETSGGIREHRPGEGIRDVHWGASARLRRLVIRLREAEPQPSPRRSPWPEGKLLAPCVDLYLMHVATGVAVVAAIAFGWVSGLMPPAIAALAGGLAALGSAASARRQGKPGRWLHALLYLGILAVLGIFLLKLQRPVASRSAMPELVALVMGLFAWDLRNRAYLRAQQLFALLMIAILPAFLAPRDTLLVGLSYGATLLALWLASWSDGRHAIGYAKVRLRDLSALPSRWLPLAAIGLVAYLAQPWLPELPLPALPTFGLSTTRTAPQGDQAARLPGEAGTISLDARWSTSDAVVARLEGQVPLRLRVETFDTYREGRWTRSEVARDSWGRAETEAAQHWLTLLIPGADRLPLPETTVGTLTPLERPLLGSDGSLFNPSGLREGYRYRVTLGPEVRWRTVAPTAAEKAFNTVPGDLTRLAPQYVEQTPSLDAAMRALASRLQRDCRYDLDAPRPPAGADPAQFFVTASHRGFCLHYASALALMGRALGIPTRLVVGYAAGEKRGDEIVYRAKDAHAWVEAFVEGRWVSYDPTPEARARASRGLDPHQALLAGVLFLLGLYGWAARRQPAIFHRYQRALKRLARRGVPITPSTSPREALKLASNVLDARAYAELVALIERYEAERFAPPLTKSAR